jgi:putative transposase
VGEEGAMPGPRPPSVDLTDEERRALEGLVRRHTTGQQLADRARVVLLAADGLNNSEIARQLALEPDTVRLWRRRWLRVAGADPADLPVPARLADAPRSGTPARISPERVCRIMALACEAPGASGRPISQWSTTELAAEIMRRGIVATISPRHAARLLKRGISSRTASGIG